ncbi:uncharacterized protein LOC129735993 [Falco cherrug]|uniref:uncharacterized protein LOC129735993 n=1 Tax=Falco cherrug TaxID=345164 RepID=UPI002479FCD5|nr:uncharacterized protein LOC129735993 [Falco cherrug]
MLWACVSALWPRTAAGEGEPTWPESAPMVNTGDADARSCWLQLAVACVLLCPGLQLYASPGHLCLSPIPLPPFPKLFLVLTPALAVAEQGGSWAEPILLRSPASLLPGFQNRPLGGCAGPALPSPRSSGLGATPSARGGGVGLSLELGLVPSPRWWCWGVARGSAAMAALLGTSSGPGGAGGSHRVAPGPVLNPCQLRTDQVHQVASVLLGTVPGWTLGVESLGEALQRGERCLGAATLGVAWGLQGRVEAVAGAQSCSSRAHWCGQQPAPCRSAWPGPRLPPPAHGLGPVPSNPAELRSQRSAPLQRCPEAELGRGVLSWERTEFCKCASLYRS